MKKLLPFLVIIIISTYSYTLQAQCTPGNYTHPGIYPDTTTGLPPAAATATYNLVVTIVVPKDSTIEFGGVPTNVTVDSIGVTGVSGLPSGFSYHPNSSSGYWHGDSSGCVLITGTPSSVDTGTHGIQIHMQAYASGFAAPYTYTGYELVVFDSTHVGAGSHSDMPDEVTSFPNPFHNSLTVSFGMQKAKEVSVAIYNMVGHMVNEQTIHAIPGENQVVFDTAELSSGMYFYRIKAADKVVTRKIVRK